MQSLVELEGFRVPEQHLDGRVELPGQGFSFGLEPQAVEGGHELGGGQTRPFVKVNQTNEVRDEGDAREGKLNIG